MPGVGVLGFGVVVFGSGVVSLAEGVPAAVSACIATPGTGMAISCDAAALTSGFKSSAILLPAAKNTKAYMTCIIFLFRFIPTTPFKLYTFPISAPHCFLSIKNASAFPPEDMDL